MPAGKSKPKRPINTENMRETFPKCVSDTTVPTLSEDMPEDFAKSPSELVESIMLSPTFVEDQNSPLDSKVNRQLQLIQSHESKLRTAIKESLFSFHATSSGFIHDSKLNFAKVKAYEGEIKAIKEYLQQVTEELATTKFALSQSQNYLPFIQELLNKFEDLYETFKHKQKQILYIDKENQLLRDKFLSLLKKAEAESSEKKSSCILL